LAYRALSHYEVFCVDVSQLRMYSTPGSGGKFLLVLRQGDQIVSQGRDTFREGSRWVNVVHLLRHSATRPEDARVGWVSAQSSGSDRPFLKYEQGFFKRQVAIRNVLKWKALVHARSLVQSYPVLQRILRHNPYHVDKILHILAAIGLSTGVFLALAAANGAKWPTLMGTFLVTNLFGLVNEILDQWTHTGDFELRDMYANLAGSIVAVALFFLCWSALERGYMLRGAHREASVSK